MQALSVYQSVLIYNGRANLFFQTLYKIAGVKMRKEEKKKRLSEVSKSVNVKGWVEENGKRLR